jgi:hypothetical protein
MLFLAASAPNNSAAHERLTAKCGSIVADGAAQGTGDAPIACGAGNRAPARENGACADAKDLHRSDAPPMTQAPHTMRGTQSAPDHERESGPFEPDRFWDWIQQNAQ